MKNQQQRGASYGRGGERVGGERVGGRGRGLGRGRSLLLGRQAGAGVELEEDDVAVLDDVELTLLAVLARRLGTIQMKKDHR